MAFPLVIISLRFRHGGEKITKFVLRSRQDKFMGRKRKDFSDKFKIEVARKALKKREKEAEVAVKYNIAPGTLSEWMAYIEIRMDFSSELQV